MKIANSENSMMRLRNELGIRCCLPLLLEAPAYAGTRAANRSNLRLCPGAFSLRARLSRRLQQEQQQSRSGRDRFPDINPGRIAPHSTCPSPLALDADCPGSMKVALM